MRVKKRIKLQSSPKGIFSQQGKQKVAATLWLAAFGTKKLDGTKVAQIRFRNFDGQRVTELFDLADLLPRNQHRFIDRLANKGYRWPADKDLISSIIELLTASRPKRRFTVVGAPGWYDGVYVTPEWEVGRTETSWRSYEIDPDSGANIGSFRTGVGSLSDWKKTVAKVAQKSSCFRLSIAAAFASTILRPLNMDSFGLNVYGPTSEGKSTLLAGAASVPGLIGENGLPSWGDSPPAIEQLAVGHRDGLLPLDEAAEADGREMTLDAKARLLAFAIARNRPRNVDKKYAKSSKLPRDYRVITLSASERALGSIAKDAGKSRLGGEEVRLIDVPATSPGSHGIFDGPLKCKKGRDPHEQAGHIADELRRNAELNQGFALRQFLKRLTKDPDAISTLQAYCADFEKLATASMIETGDRRIKKNFAVLYAAAALAIDYHVLPWKKKATFRAIDKCMTASFDAVSLVHGNQPDVVSTIVVVARRLRTSLEMLNLIDIRKGTKPQRDEITRRQDADGFRIGHDLYVKSKGWKEIPSVDGKVLAAHKILKTETRGDNVLTVSKKIAGIKQKLRYYIIDSKALDQALRRNTVSLTV